jgi:hypothetical protein
VSLLLQCNHPAVAGKEREHSAEVRVDRRAAAVKKHERCPVMAAVNFVIDVDAAYGRPAGLDWRRTPDLGL